MWNPLTPLILTFSSYKIGVCETLLLDSFWRFHHMKLVYVKLSYSTHFDAFIIWNWCMWNPLTPLILTFSSYEIGVRGTLFFGSFWHFHHMKLVYVKLSYTAHFDTFIIWNWYMWNPLSRLILTLWSYEIGVCETLLLGSFWRFDHMKLVYVKPSYQAHFDAFIKWNWCMWSPLTPLILTLSSNEIGVCETLLLSSFWRFHQMKLVYVKPSYSAHFDA